MSADQLTVDEAVKLGISLRDYGNPIVGSFAAELCGESYPFNAAMAEIMLQDFDDETLGRRFAKWIDEYEAKRNQTDKSRDKGPL